MKTKEEVQELRRVPMPTYNKDGLGQCDEDECQQYDGSRCRLLGFPPSRSGVCEPWAQELLGARKLDKEALDVAVRWLRAHGLMGGVETVERVLSGQSSPLFSPADEATAADVQSNVERARSEAVQRELGAEFVQTVDLVAAHERLGAEEVYQEKINNERESGRSVPITPVPEHSHKERHVMLHRMLDELLADFMANTPYLPSKTILKILMEWSYRQTVEPDHEDTR